MLTYRQAQLQDLDEIMNIYVQAQEFMESQGNPQWPKGFPNRMDTTGGIYGGVMYVVCDDQTICGAFSVLIHDEDYDEIAGEWLTEGNYLAVHRVAVAKEYRGKGVAKFILQCSEQLAHQMSRGSLRFDTHEKNIPMLSLLDSNGFTRCGYITLMRDDTFRIAFEKVID